jgi:hypothetical protein
MKTKTSPITHLESYAHEHYKEPYHCPGKKDFVKCGMWIDADQHEWCPVCGQPVKVKKKTK